MRLAFETLTLNIEGLQVAGIRHRDASLDNDVRMLCLHGWLDNAASFLPLMPYLPAIDMVAIDLPGHGYSAHAPKGISGGYSLFDYASTAHRVMDALGWQTCNLAGHSLGGCIAPIVAVGASERIPSLITIDAAGPLSEDPAGTPARIARAMQDRLSPERFSSRLFKTRDAAVDARLAATKMARTSAKLIIDRQLREAEDGGFRWRFDPALRYSSPQYFSEEQVHALLGAVTCPSLSVVADDGFLSNRDNTAERLACYKDHLTVELSGQHHLHMDTPEPVAAAINAFLGTRPALGG
jgi:pimeloyl-ACP methyl ester carboxylesterase